LVDIRNNKTTKTTTDHTHKPLPSLTTSIPCPDSDRWVITVYVLSSKLKRKKNNRGPDSHTHTVMSDVEDNNNLYHSDSESDGTESESDFLDEDPSEENHMDVNSLTQSNPFIKKVFIIEVNRETKRIQIDGCRYNERLNSKTQGSSPIHWVIDCVYYNDKTKDSTGEVKGVKVSVL
jgi:primase-polymerase (primpol)-like protein